MSAITPQTELRLLKCPIESDNRNQLTFSNETAQTNYFKSLPHLEVDNFTYQRKDSVIRYPAHIDSILTYNYVMYQNENYTNKWFYAFITKMEYVNDNMTLITIKTDVYQTWMFSMIWKKSFVEREHVNDDTAGLHTIPEGLETGEFTCNSHTVDSTFDSVMTDLVYVISSAINLWIIDSSTNKYTPATPTYYNGIASGTQYFKFNDTTALNNKLKDVAARGQIESINGLFMAPSSLTTLRPNSTSEIAESTTPITYTNSISKQTTLNGYTPINKKLLTGEYNYLLVSNNNGNSVIFRYEDFSQSNCTFKIDMCLTAGCSIRMIPSNYKNVSDGDEYGINLGKLPICSYPCDMYTNWLTQNSVNVMGIQVSSDTLNLVTSVANFLNPMSGGGLMGIADSLIAKKQHELIPPQSRGNLNAGDVVTASGKNTFHFYKMSIKKEYAKAIDGFFSMYGYKVNSLKLPNITGRTNWNYVKTIGANIEGDIPEDHLNEIKTIFNNGVTLWHNSNTYLDYSQSNAIVS